VECLLQRRGDLRCILALVLQVDRRGEIPAKSATGAGSADTRGEGCVGGRNLFINAASDAASQDAAWKFIQFLTSDNTQQERAVNEVWLPTREAVYRRPEVQQVPIIPTAKAALDNARARPTHRYYPEMSAAMAEQFNLCLTGQVSPTEAAQTLQTRLSDILRRP
jgi:ABC-type glycerol-3-phosphate transport system substrate-binding protein